MRRREFIVLLAMMATPIAALAQQPGKIRHIGFLRVGPPPPAFIEGFRRGLRERGYLVAAGPLTGEPGTGMTILRLPGAGRAGEAARLATEDDPSVAGGLFSITISPWQVMLEA